MSTDNLNIGDITEVTGSDLKKFDVEPTRQSDNPPASPALAVKPGSRILIQLEENDNIPPTGQFIGLNGKGYILRPGEAAEVPVELLHILDNAIMDAPIIDPTNRKVVGWRKRLRFPYRVLGHDSRQAA